MNLEIRIYIYYFIAPALHGCPTAESCIGYLNRFNSKNIFSLGQRPKLRVLHLLIPDILLQLAAPLLRVASTNLTFL